MERKPERKNNIIKDTFIYTFQIYFATLIGGSLLLAFIMGLSRFRFDFSFSAFITEMVGAFFTYLMYGTLFSFIPGILLLFAGNYLILRYSKPDIHPKWIASGLALFISAVVIGINLIMFGNIEIFYIEIPFAVSAVVCSFFIYTLNTREK